MLALMLAAGEGPRVFVYGFFFNYLYRLLTLAGLMALHDSGGALARRVARALSRPPHPEQPSMPVRVETKTSSSPGGLSAYLAVVAGCAAFTFVLTNVKDQEIVTPVATILAELRLGAAAGGLWWLLDLVDRRLAIRFGEPAWSNFGYNSMETTLLAVTVLTGGLVSAFAESPWPYFVALIVFKTWFDVWTEARYPRTEHPLAGERPVLRD
jgi:hypothetical protein